MWGFMCVSMFVMVSVRSEDGFLWVYTCFFLMSMRSDMVFYMYVCLPEWYGICVVTYMHGIVYMLPLRSEMSRVRGSLSCHCLCAMLNNTLALFSGKIGNGFSTIQKWTVEKIV